MNQQRIERFKSVLSTRCQCCCRERPTREMWSEHFVHGDMINYGVMLKRLCRIPWPETDMERICHPCIGRLKDAVDFQKQAHDAQHFINQLMINQNNEDADIESKLDGFLDRYINIPNKSRPMKTEESHNDSDNSYTEIEYLDVDCVDVVKIPVINSSKNIAVIDNDSSSKVTLVDSPEQSEKPKKDPRFIVLGDTVIQKIEKKPPVIDLMIDDDNDFSSPLVKVARVAKTPAYVTGSSETNETAGVVTNIEVPHRDNPIKVISEVREKFLQPRKVTTYKYIPVSPEKNLNLQARIERKMHQDNLVALLLSTNATPMKGKYDTGYRCGFCREVFVLASELKTHTITCHTDEQKSKYLVNVEMYRFIVKLDVTNHRCNICGDSLNDYNGVWQHLKDHGVKVHLDLKNQIIPYKIQDNGIFSCFFCDLQFAYFRALSVHMNRHLNNYICESCGSGFLTRRNMLIHARVHTLGDYKCSHCDRHFSVKFRLQMHIRKVHINKKRVNNVCGFCGERFSDSSVKVRHLEKEHGVKRTLFKCDKCDKSLTSRTSLKNHIENVHMRLKKYECPVCSKRCFEKTNMEKHIANKHGKAKNNVVCNICLKVFTKAKLLKIHERMHQKDRNFVCGLCEDQFEYKSGLLSHLRGRHGVINPRAHVAIPIPQVTENADKDVHYECIICRTKCHLKEKMMEHLNSSHGVADENFDEFVNEVEASEDEEE